MTRWISPEVIDLALEDAHEAHKSGDPCALFYAIRVAGDHGIPLPQWAVSAFAEGYNKVWRAEVGSWDEAFGRPIPKRKQLAAARRNKLLEYKVYSAVVVAAETHPIDESLFEKVGREFKISGSTARDYYYGKKRTMSVLMAFFPPSTDADHAIASLPTMGIDPDLARAITEEIKKSRKY